MKEKDRWLPLPLADLEGNSFMRIENYQGILEFTRQLIKLKMRGMIYQIEGESLLVRGITKREIFIEGKVKVLRIIQESKE